MTLRMPPNIEPLAVLKKRTVSGEGLIDVKNRCDADGWRRGVVVDARPKSHKLRLLVWFPVPGMYELDVHCRNCSVAKESKEGCGDSGAAGVNLVLTYVIDAREATRQLMEYRSGNGANKAVRSPRASPQPTTTAAKKKVMKRSDTFSFRAW